MRCLSSPLFTLFPPRICFTVEGPLRSDSNQHMSSPLFSMNAPIGRSWAITMCSSPGRSIMPKILTGYLQFLCRLIQSHVKRYHSPPVLPYNRRLNILCLHQNGKQSLPLVCWCNDQGRGANSCKRHETTHSGVITRPYWDVGTSGLIIFIGDRSGQTASEKPSEILPLDVQWKLVFATQSKLGEGGTNRLSGGAGHSSKVVTDSGSCLIERRH